METKTTSTVWQNETTLRLKNRNKMLSGQKNCELVVCVNNLSSLQTACFLCSVKQPNVID